MMRKDTYIRQNRIQKKEYQQGYRGAFHNHNEIHQKIITILNMYSPNKRALKYMKQN